ncbi:hypothetical protein Mycsm_03823 [Mycobacterium sp. JS623]|nr:hypothetical protein Mycsm_03823 [Mycobacterium sp. JS623]
MPALRPDLDIVTEKDQVPVTGWQKPVQAAAVWRWLTAAAPLVAGTEGSFIDRALPLWVRERRFKGLTDGDD